MEHYVKGQNCASKLGRNFKRGVHDIIHYYRLSIHAFDGSFTEDGHEFSVGVNDARSHS